MGDCSIYEFVGTVSQTVHSRNESYKNRTALPCSSNNGTMPINIEKNEKFH